MTETIYLIGARAAGKSTVGALLARALGLDFADTDTSLEESAGQSIAQIVATGGWPAFRKRESEVLRAVSKPGTVVATGGGMVLAEANRAFMRLHGLVLFLAAPPEVLAARLEVQDAIDSRRPSLTGQSITTEMAEIVRQRTPLYIATAHHRLDASQSIENVLTQALEYADLNLFINR